MIDPNPVLKQLAQLSQEASAKEHAFLQHMLLVASSAFAILISLHPSVPEARYSRWVFFLATITLGAGILCNSIALYNQSKLVRRTQHELSKEARAAIREERSPGPVKVEKNKIHVFCERATYILLPFALVLLCTYAVCNAFAL